MSRATLLRPLDASGLPEPEVTAMVCIAWKPDLSVKDDFPVCAKKKQMAAFVACDAG